MSYIKRLKLQGFKSFANLTVLSFEKGFNTIVGANGSGKSNVFDAMCFVLGRLSSKELRTEKLGNLVFNGGKNLKAAKEAEVSIYLNNEDRSLLDAELDEIKVTRIVKKDGQSNYFLNNKKVTRTEIVEVLRRASINPDGYNIILQGDIVKIVNMTPIERRELIEEISNISGYEEKREKAVKKLDKVDQDLKDADLLMEEKTKYLKELKSEKEQAEKYRKVKEDLRYESLLLLKARIIRNNVLREKKEEDLKKVEEELAEYRSKLDEFEKKSKEIDSRIEEIENKIEVESHNDFISVTNKITSLEAEISSLKEKKAENKKQTQEIKTRSQGVKENIKKNNEEIKKLNEELSSFNKQKKELDSELKEVDLELTKYKKNTSSESLKKIDELDAEIDELNKKKSDKNLIRQDNAIQVEKLNTKIEHLQDDLKRIEGLNSENKDKVKELDDYRIELKKIIVNISNLSNKTNEASAKISSLEKEYSELVEEHSRSKMKLDASKDVMATNRAVDTISKLKEKDSKIHGTVADLASVPDKYSLAMETCAGKSLFNIVVEDDKTAVKYINYLKQNKIGSVTFLPLNKINAKYKLDDSVMAKKGAIDYALNLVSYDKKYENIFNLVFGDTLVIENVEDARNIGIGAYRMVSLEGDFVAKSGSMSGGYKSRKQGLGIFKDDKLVEKVKVLGDKISMLKSSLDLVKDEKSDNERELYELRNRKIEVESEIAKLEKVLSIEGKDTSNIKKEIEAIVSDKAVIDSSLKKIDKDISSLDSKIQDLILKKTKLKGDSSSSDLMSSINSLEEKKDSIKEKLMKTDSEVGRINIQINNVLTPEIKNLDKILKDNTESLNSLSTKLSEYDEKLKSLEKDYKENKDKEKELSKGYKDLISKRDNFREDKHKLEAKYEKQFQKFDSIKDKASQLRYAISEYKTLNDTLDNELSNYYEQLRAELFELGDDTEINSQIGELIQRVEKHVKEKSVDVKELQNKVNNLKTRINSFGSINMKAVEIYDKLSEEFNELLEKRKTLNDEKTNILEFIAEIDEKKKERFMETFATLKENFVNIFSKLSTKGQVELNIENEKDLFNSGVEIKVRLSDKNYLDIKSLSGGEKTITAVAFIFAIQEFNPASFYVLDEIDAALDIINSEKLGKLIREYSSKAQYIVVSHSEYFIQSSEVIYGVTMDNNKISDVVSLDLRQTKDYLDDSLPTAKS